MSDDSKQPREESILARVDSRITMITVPESIIAVKRIFEILRRLRRD